MTLTDLAFVLFFVGVLATARDSRGKWLEYAGAALWLLLFLFHLAGRSV